MSCRQFCWTTSLVLVLLAGMIPTLSSYEYHPLTQELRNRFYTHFEKRCTSFSFVDDYMRLLYDTDHFPSAKFASFVFVDDYRHRQMHLGGLGDRLAGLLSTFFWSLRYQRVLLLEDWQGEFSQLFSPLPPKLYALLQARKKKNISSGNNLPFLWTEYSELLQRDQETKTSSSKQSFFRKEQQSLTAKSSQHSELDISWSHWHSILHDSRIHGSDVGNKTKTSVCSSTKATSNDYDCFWRQLHTQRSSLPTYFCHNADITRFRFRHCALDEDFEPKDATTSVNWVRVRHNRAFLCRWKNTSLSRSSSADRLSPNKTPHSPLVDSLQGDLGLWAGCALRLLLWPTDRLWKHLDRYLRSQLKDDPTFKTRYSSPLSTETPLEVTAVHFRCGDHNYPGARNVSSPATQYQTCVSSSSSPITGNVTFAGTAPLSELSRSSPNSLSVCAAQSTHYPRNPNTTRLYLLASDSDTVITALRQSVTQAQDGSHVSPSHTITVSLPTGCHIDYLYHTRHGHDPSGCMRDTLLTWMFLSLGDTLVVQSVLEEDETQPFPKFISSFSRSAAWYSLGGSGDRDRDRFGIVEQLTVFASTDKRNRNNCWSATTQRRASSNNTDDTFGFGKRSEGNWQCD